MFIESVMPSNHLILFQPLLLLLSTFPSIRVFFNESALCIRWPKYWSFSISPSNEYSRLISFRIYWFDLLAVQGTLKHLWQHHSSKAAVLQCSAFFMIQLTSAQNYWKIQSFDYTNLCWQSDPSAFQPEVGEQIGFSSHCSDIGRKCANICWSQHQPGTLWLIVQAPIKCLCCPPLTPAPSTSQMEKETQSIVTTCPRSSGAKQGWQEYDLLLFVSLCTVSTHWLDQA